MLKYYRSLKAFAKKVASFEADILLTIFYIIFLIPLSIFVKGKIEKNFIASRKKKSYWIKREEEEQDLVWASKQ